jgi:hypothetical protein
MAIPGKGGVPAAAAGAGKKQRPDLAQRQQKARDTLTSLGVDPTLTGTIPHPGDYLKSLRSGKGPAWDRMRLLQGASGYYQKPQQQLEAEQEKALAEGAPVDFKQQEDQMLGQLQSYVTDRLGIGLTPTEESSLRANLETPIAQTYEQAGRQESTAASQAGIDPRSGASRTKAMQLAGQKAGAFDTAEQQISQTDLERKQQIEQEAAGVAAGEEGARQFDVNAQLQRLAQVEGGMAGLSGLREQQRQYDVGETESQRQADLARQQWAAYARSLKPSGWEKASSIFGGVLGGLGVGGAGGGGGGGFGG